MKELLLGTLSKGRNNVKNRRNWSALVVTPNDQIEKGWLDRYIELVAMHHDQTENKFNTVYQEDKLTTYPLEKR